MVHLERLDGLKIVRFHHVWAADELSVMAKYVDCEIHIEMEWGGDLVLTMPKETSEDIFHTVCDHMRAYRAVWPHTLERAKARYAEISKSAG